MKILFATFLLFFSYLTYCQPSYQITDTSKQWNTLAAGIGVCAVVGYENTYSNKLFGDTIINNRRYFKLYKSTDSLQLYWEQIGFLREDPINKLVYFRSGENEGLIYNFNLSIGDSIYINNFYMGFLDALLICNSIDSVNINGTYKKRYYLSEYLNSINNEIWVEGIGCLDGLLCSGIHAVGFCGGFRDLLCCFKSDTLLYIDTVYNSCFIDNFQPNIIQEYYDTAYLNKYYEFQLNLTDTSNIDSVNWGVCYCPSFLSLNEETGLLYGTPTSASSFPCAILVRNNDIGLNTDILISDLIVLNPTIIKDITKNIRIQISPNPCRNELSITIDTKNSEQYYFEVLNITGEIIEKMIIKSGTSIINCVNYKKGIYLCKIKNFKNRIIKTEKVIIL